MKGFPKWLSNVPKSLTCAHEAYESTGYKVNLRYDSATH